MECDSRPVCSNNNNNNNSDNNNDNSDNNYENKRSIWCTLITVKYSTGTALQESVSK